MVILLDLYDYGITCSYVVWVSIEKNFVVADLWIFSSIRQNSSIFIFVVSDPLPKIYALLNTRNWNCVTPVLGKFLSSISFFFYLVSTLILLYCTLFRSYTIFFVYFSQYCFFICRTLLLVLFLISLCCVRSCGCHVF